MHSRLSFTPIIHPLIECLWRTSRSYPPKGKFESANKTLCRKIKTGTFNERIELSNAYKGWPREIFSSLELSWQHYTVITTLTGTHSSTLFVHLLNGWFGFSFGFKYVTWTSVHNVEAKRERQKKSQKDNRKWPLLLRLRMLMQLHMVMEILIVPCCPTQYLGNGIHFVWFGFIC